MTWTVHVFISFRIIHLQEYDGYSNSAMELIDALLMVNPTKRATAAEALQMDYFRDADTLSDYSVEYLDPPPEGFFKWVYKNNDSKLTFISNGW